MDQFKQLQSFVTAATRGSLTATALAEGPKLAVVPAWKGANVRRLTLVGEALPDKQHLLAGDGTGLSRNFVCRTTCFVNPRSSRLLHSLLGDL